MCAIVDKHMGWHVAMVVELSLRVTTLDDY